MAKRYEELTFADDFLFCKILMNNPELCRELTELIIGRKIGGIVKIDKQMPIELTSDGRGVRFDIYMEDDENTVYNIEMQTGSVRELPYRTRYYQGMIDLNQMERGSAFRELKNSYIIFICLDNLFPETGLHKYSFRTICAENRDLELGDGTQKIILAAKGSRDDVSDELKAFLTYVAGNAPESDLTKRLEKSVEEARKHIRWRKEYMTLLERDEQMREEGRKEGIEEGHEEGRKEGLKEGLKKGRVEGRKEGEDRMAKLFSLLLADGRASDAEKAAVDPDVRDALFRKYHLV